MIRRLVVSGRRTSLAARTRFDYSPTQWDSLRASWHLVWPRRAAAPPARSRIQSALARPVEPRQDVAAQYAVACPDRLEVRVLGRPELNRVMAVEADGCVPCGELGRVRVDGTTADEVAQSLTRLMRLPPGAVQVAVAEHASRHVLVFGPGQGVQRAYRISATRPPRNCCARTGGLTPGTAFHAVHVIRPHVAAGRRPELFDVDLRAIVLKGDPATDVVLQPYDQVYLGETRGLRWSNACRRGCGRSAPA